MRKLENNEKDKKHLQELLLSGIKPKAEFQLGVFTTIYASSFKLEKYEGVVTSIDFESGYCDWINIEGSIMPCVKINCITLID